MGLSFLVSHWTIPHCQGQCRANSSEKKEKEEEVGEKAIQKKNSNYDAERKVKRVYWSKCGLSTGRNKRLQIQFNADPSFVNVNCFIHVATPSWSQEQEK